MAKSWSCEQAALKWWNILVKIFMFEAVESFCLHPSPRFIRKKLFQLLIIIVIQVEIDASRPPAPQQRERRSPNESFEDFLARGEGRCNWAWNLVLYCDDLSWVW